VELILQVGSSASYAMIFALLIAAILWNLGTWALGIPNSSSHALIGSIMGVGIVNQLMAPAGVATSGVDWGQALNVAEALLFSPMMGFLFSALLLLVMKFLVQAPKLYEEPRSKAPPPWWIRATLIFTCTGVSFAHGGNDGQKGMGLIMLILIGAAPTAYALNRTMPDAATPGFVQSAIAAQSVFAAHAVGQAPVALEDSRAIIGDALRTKELNRPQVYASLATISGDIAMNVKNYGALARVPAEATPNLRNDMYLTGDAIRLLPKQGAQFTAAETTSLKTYTGWLQNGTRFIPSGSRFASPLRWAWAPWWAGSGSWSRRRAHRQDAPDLCAGRIGGNGGRSHHRRGGGLWASRVHDAHSLQRRGWNDGGERLRFAVEHRALHRDGMGADASRRHGHRRGAVFHPAPFVLTQRVQNFARSNSGSEATLGKMWV